MEKNTKVILIFFSIIAVLLFVMLASLPKQANEEAVNVNLDNGFFPALGHGEIEIIEFSDFECPVCGKQEAVLREVLDSYGDKIKLYYKHFPLSMHKNSFDAALASFCADEQGKFWEYHDLLFENQGNLDKEGLKKYGQELGLNEVQFNSCLDNKKYKDEVNQDREEGKEAGITGTPTFFIDGKRYRGFQSLENFENIIKEAGI